ncbi:MAG: FABP family protein, partial [Acidimicrobiia bacterium]
GRGEYPTIRAFEYAESITFTHVGKPFLAYSQRTRSLGDDGRPPQPMHAESGYWRFPEPGRVEVGLSPPTGVVEIEEGTVTVQLDGSLVLDLATTTVALTSTAKEVTSVRRRLHVHGDTIDYELAMSAVGVPLVPHLYATLYRELPE